MPTITLPDRTDDCSLSNFSPTIVSFHIVLAYPMNIHARRDVEPATPLTPKDGEELRRRVTSYVAMTSKMTQQQCGVLSWQHCHRLVWTAVYEAALVWVGQSAALSQSPRTLSDPSFDSERRRRFRCVPSRRPELGGRPRRQLRHRWHRPLPMTSL